MRERGRERGSKRKRDIYRERDRERSVFYVYIHHVVPNTDLISFLDTLLVTFVLLITKSCDL